MPRKRPDYLTALSASGILASFFGIMFFFLDGDKYGLVFTFVLGPISIGLLKARRIALIAARILWSLLFLLCIIAFIDYLFIEKSADSFDIYDALALLVMSVTTSPVWSKDFKDYCKI
ncbi:hypothetical protein ACFL6Y_06555 [Elusimicrobiota bacterium]